ncbi:MAG TPA: hypothetical protein VHU40_02240 [Polyangia bacterium]|jgi:hypothetical protein|nr:hypothetical protein [Polyangia bacterium]
MRRSERARPVLAVLAMLALAANAGCDARGAARRLVDRFTGSHAAPALAWQDVEPAALVVNNDPVLHAVRFSIHLPPSAGSRKQALPAPVALELSFQEPIDGAKVDATASGPLHTITLLDHKRFGGDTVAAPLPPLPLTDVEVIVHNHLRPPPVIRRVRVGRPLAAPAPAVAARVKP